MWVSCHVSVLSCEWVVMWVSVMSVSCHVSELSCQCVVMWVSVMWVSCHCEWVVIVSELFDTSTCTRPCCRVYGDNEVVVWLQILVKSTNSTHGSHNKQPSRRLIATWRPFVWPWYNWWVCLRCRQLFTVCTTHVHRLCALSQCMWTGADGRVVCFEREV